MEPLNIPSFQLKRDWRLLVTLAMILLAILGSSLLSHGSPVVMRKSLATFPQKLYRWTGIDVPINAETLEVLRATDTVNRAYLDLTNQRRIDLFVGFFSSQRKGGAIHSPKNCLPGSGWEPIKSDILLIRLMGSGKTIEVNQYIIQNGVNKQLVLYWYQSQGRTIASEYTAKICLIWDAIRRNRTDGALVRVISPIVNDDERGAVEEATSFVQASFSQLTESLPN